MTRKRPPARPSAGGLKALIGAAAAAITLGGWAALAEPPVAPAAIEVAPAARPTLAPIPTLVPLTDAPAPAAAPAALREVSAPPAPARPAAVTRTRSSQ